MGTLGDRERAGCLQLAHAGFERGSLTADALEFGLGFGFAQMAADRETEDPLALGPEAVHRASERDALSLRDRRLVLATELCLKVREHVARVAQEALDVRPDLPLDLGAAKESTRAGPAKGTPVRLATTAAVPARARPPLAPDIRQAAAPTPDDALEQVASMGVAAHPAVSVEGLLRCLPQLLGDEGFDGGRDDFAHLLRPPAELKPAHVLGLDDHVPNPPAAPEALGALPALAPLHLAARPGIARRDREGVELEGDPRTAPAVDREAAIDLADDVGRRKLERVRQGPRVRHQVGRLLAVLRDVPEGNDAAGVAAFARGALHAVGAALAEDPLFVLGEGRLDVEHEWVGLALDQAHEADPEMAEPAADDRHVHEITPEPIQAVDPQLVEAARFGIAQEAPAIGPLGDPLRARDGLVDVPIDERDIGLAREAAIECVALGLDRLALALVL